MQRLRLIQRMFIGALVSFNDHGTWMLMLRALGLVEEAPQAPPVRTLLGLVGL